MLLEIELIPKTSFFNNVRSLVSESEWDSIRMNCYKAAKFKCEICDGVGPKWPVECHEAWEYKKGTQRLIRLIALCPSCHEVKHLGLARFKGRYEEAIKHLQKVNKISYREAIEAEDDAFSTWRRRNKTNWKLDISFLTTTNPQGI